MNRSQYRLRNAAARAAYYADQQPRTCPGCHRELTIRDFAHRARRCHTCLAAT